MSRSVVKRFNGSPDVSTFKLASLFLVVLSLSTALMAGDATRRPNIVLIVIDDLGYGELGCYGGTEIPTPQIDSLAKTGVRFSQGYVTASLCAPSRAALLTGRYQTRFGYEMNPVGVQNMNPGVGVDVAETMLPEILREHGYATGIVGKWHLGSSAPFHPQRRGFDEFFGFLHEGHYYVPPPWEGVSTWLRRAALPDGTKGVWSSPDGRQYWSTQMGYREPDYDTDNPLLRSSQPAAEREYLTDAFAREAENFIDRHASQPFFLYLAFNAVHSPMQGKDEWMKKFSSVKDPHRRIFAAILGCVDEAVGRVTQKLKALNLQNDTLIVLLSDNGGPTRELTSSNKPLRGEKGTLYEGGVRIPFMLSWPEKIPADKTDTRVISSLDLMPTILAAAQINEQPKKPIDGVNLLPLLSKPGEALTRPLYWRTGGSAAYRDGDWKIVGKKKGAQWDWELFNLANDLEEKTNRAAESPDKLSALVKSWETLNQEMKPAQ
jgi:arylsulfatase A-like enzyme